MIMSRRCTISKTIAILQSNYIPWKGYFDIINMVDEFILYDDVQYTRHDWRNRNKLKSPNGIIWLTIPVKASLSKPKKIYEVQVADKRWAIKHLKTIKQYYSKADFYQYYIDDLEEVYLKASEFCLLYQINRIFLQAICSYVGINTIISSSMDYSLSFGKTERLIELCQKCEASHYLSGPSASNYLQPELFEKSGIKLTYMEYSGYPEYNQLYPPFEHNVSILDLILNVGPDSIKYMKSS